MMSDQSKIEHAHKCDKCKTRAEALGISLEEYAVKYLYERGEKNEK